MKPSRLQLPVHHHHYWHQAVVAEVALSLPENLNVVDWGHEDGDEQHDAGDAVGVVLVEEVVHVEAWRSPSWRRQRHLRRAALVKDVLSPHATLNVLDLGRRHSVLVEQYS
jgi:hypothetical protein